MKLLLSNPMPVVSCSQLSETVFSSVSDLRKRKTANSSHREETTIGSILWESTARIRIGFGSRDDRSFQRLGGMAIALIALSAMEIVLGIDNIVFISIATSKLPKEQQARARLIGLSLAMGFRIVLLCFIATIVSWTQPLFRLDQLLPGFLHFLLAEVDEINAVSVRDLILFGGGLFLIYQSVREIHHLTEAHDEVEAW